MKIWETATLYQFIHALGILFVATRSLTRPSSKLDWSATLFTAGTLLFSGSLYLMTLTHKKWLGAITPIGGSSTLNCSVLSSFLNFRAASLILV